MTREMPKSVPTRLATAAGLRVDEVQNEIANWKPSYGREEGSYSDFPFRSTFGPAASQTASGVPPTALGRPSTSGERKTFEHFQKSARWCGDEPHGKNSPKKNSKRKNGSAEKQGAGDGSHLGKQAGRDRARDDIGVQTYAAQGGFQIRILL
jgi:hypothetical protein